MLQQIFNSTTRLPPKLFRNHLLEICRNFTDITPVEPFHPSYKDQACLTKITQATCILLAEIWSILSIFSLVSDHLPFRTTLWSGLVERFHSSNMKVTVRNGYISCDICLASSVTPVDNPANPMVVWELRQLRMHTLKEFEYSFSNSNRQASALLNNYIQFSQLSISPRPRNRKIYNLQNYVYKYSMSVNMQHLWTILYICSLKGINWICANMIKIIPVTEIKKTVTKSSKLKILNSVKSRYRVKLPKQLP